MIEIKKLIIDQAGKTSMERDLAMLSLIEKSMGTGPIIGEAREVLLTMSRNIMVRDLLLDSMGCPVDKRESIFHMINNMLDEQDKDILEARKGVLQ